MVGLDCRQTCITWSPSFAVSPVTDDIDFELDIGVYAFVLPKKMEEMLDVDRITHMLCRSDSRTVPLSADIVVCFAEIGSVWKLENNYSLGSCMLKNTQTRASRPVDSNF